MGLYKIENNIIEKDRNREEKDLKNRRNSMKTIEQPDIVGIIVLTFLLMIVIFIPYFNGSFLRIILGILLLLFFPGYVLLAALYPKKDSFNVIEWIGLSLALSVAITSLTGIALNYTPYGVTTTPIIIILLTIILGLIAYVGRLKLPSGEKLSINPEKIFGTVKTSIEGKSKNDKIYSTVLIVSIVLAVFMMIYIMANPMKEETFTELYILGPGGNASDYPTNLTVGDEGKVIIGIFNHEYSETKYLLIVKSNNVTLKKENITLSNNEKQEIPFTFTVYDYTDQKLEFLLYKYPDDEDLYRSLHLQVNVT